jgi:hypothetical protein
MNARLKVLHEKANVKSVKLLPSTVIGRSNECDLKISSSEVSRIHCRITIQDDSVFIEDLGSANGTFVNDQILSPRQPIAVDPGTKVTIGPAEFIVDYIAPTSNTVVVRRADKNGKRIPSPARSDADHDNKDLVFSSAPERAGDLSDESTVLTDPKANPLAKAKEAASQSPVDDKPSSTVPESAPPILKELQSANSLAQPVMNLPVAACDPRSEEPNRVVASKQTMTAPNPIGAASKPLVVPPVALPVAKAIAVVAAPDVPVAKAVHPKTNPPEASTPVGRVPEPRQSSSQLQEPRPTKAVQLENPSKSRDVPPAKLAESVAVAAPQFVASEPVTEASERNQLPVVPQMTSQFAFTEGPDAHRTTKQASKQEKPSGLKSLFSVFNRKSPSTSKQPQSTQDPETDQTVTSIPALDETIVDPSFSFGAANKEPAPPAESTKQPPADDDFQNFLRQF